MIITFLLGSVVDNKEDFVAYCHDDRGMSKRQAREMLNILQDRVNVDTFREAFYA